MADVITFNAAGWCGQGKGLLQFRDSRDMPGVIGGPLLPECCQRVLGILGRHVDKLLLLAAPGNLYRHLGVALAPEPRFDDLRFFNVSRQQDFLRDVGGIIVKLRHELLNDRLVALTFCIVQHEVLAADQLAVPDEEHLHASFPVISGKCDDILIGIAGTDHLLSSGDPLNRFQLIAILGSAFEL